jgi:hypothetical protein
MGEMRNAYKTLVNITGREMTALKGRHGWEHNIKLDLREIVCESVE